MFFNHTQHSHVHISFQPDFDPFLANITLNSQYFFFAIVKFIFFVFLYIKVNNIKSYVL